VSQEVADKSTRRAVLLVATLGAFLTPFMGSAVNVALPSISRDLRMDSIELTWVGVLASRARGRVRKAELEA